MRKIREVLRLKLEVGLSARQVAISLQVGRASVGEYLNRFAASGLTWPSALTDAELQRHLFPPPPAVPCDQRPLPDWSHVHAELRRPGVTLALLWQEYRLAHPQGFQYSWFCEHYRLWVAKVDVVMPRSIERAKSCSLITPAKPHRSSTGELARSVRPRYSSRCWVPQATPSPRPPGRRSCLIGRVHTPAVLLFSAVPRRSWCPTTCAAASPRRTVTSPISTPVTETWPSTTVSLCCPPARVNPRTKPR